MKKIYEEYLEKDEEFSDIVTGTDKEINDYIKKERIECKDKFKGKSSKSDRIKFLICFEGVEARGLEEGIKFLNENIKDCGDDTYCNKLLTEEIKLMNERIDVINKRIDHLKSLL